MNIVNPIKDVKDIEKMKKSLSGRDLLLFVFGINSSLRIGDILSLKVGDVRNKTSLILSEKKTKKRKEFRFNQALLTVLKDMIPENASDDDWLFPSKRNEAKPLDRTQAWRNLNAAAKRAGITVNIGTHTLRKTWAYHRYKAGYNVAQLMTALNHSSQTETLRYIGIEQEQIDDLYDSINL
jgi:integrase